MCFTSLIHNELFIVLAPAPGIEVNDLLTKLLNAGLIGTKQENNDGKKEEEKPKDTELKQKPENSGPKELTEQDIFNDDSLTEVN